MNYPIDPQIMRFYQEMGFNQMQIRKAHEYSLRTGADVLDTLNNMPQNQPPLPPPAKQQNNYVQQPNSLPQLQASTSPSFLTPLSKIKVSDYEILFSRSSKHLQSSSKVELRQAEYPVGLLNVSNCCYLNSLLQCYFLMNQFKIAILTAQPLPNLQKALANESKTKVKRIKSQYQLLAKLKWFFTKMSLTSKKYLDPTTVLQNLVDSVGEKVSYGQQKDLSQINILIIQRLSEGLTYSKNHYQIQQQNLINLQANENEKQVKRQQYNSIFNPREGSIKKLFYGSKAEYYANSDQQHQAPIVSDFTGLILNPRAGNLYKALDDELNFEVQINGGIHKKVAYIRDEPEYLFLYINRTEYDKQQGQTLKNRHKFSFDFVIYLDRYLEKYREQHSVANEKIRELLAAKQKLITQLNNLHLLCKKVEQCHKYAQELEGWAERLPTEQEFDDEFTHLEQKLEQIEKELNIIESRKEQYHLMYIFVHRGDAVSGHYWGYGRNDSTWYKFDINTKKIQQDQIIIDLQKSAATPYALLYVKQQNLPRFDYKIWNEHLLFKEQNFPTTDFRHYLQPRLSLQTITENQQLYNEFQLRTNKAVKNRTSGEYINRYNAIKKLGKKYSDQRAKNRYLDHVDLTNNFSLFLWSKGEYELCKFTLFEQALIHASNGKLTVEKLMNDTAFLQKIQKKFRSQCKGEYYLKSYALLPKQIDKFVKLSQQYQLCSFQTIWSVVILNQADNFIEEWNREKLKHKETPVPVDQNLTNRILRLLKWIRIRQNLVRSQPYREALQVLGQPLWVSLMNREITAMILFQIEIVGIKLASLQSYMNLSDVIGSQLAIINAGNSLQVDEKALDSFKAQTAIELVSKFNQNQSNKNSQTSSINNKSNNEKRASKYEGEASPSKSNAMVKNQTPVKEKKNEQRLTILPQPIFVLQNKECWKLEELQKCQLNYDLNSRLVNFLKKIGLIREIYQKIIKSGKTLTLPELKEQGVLLNRLQKPQPPLQPEQSLI